ncbi:MAG: LiaI-LiaF-like domain-containing protein [Bacillota bacterium]
MAYPNNPPPTAPAPRGPSIVGPVLLILLGLAFLAQNLELLDVNIWTLLLRLWPVWLIAVGLDLLLGRRTAWGSWIVLGVVLTVIAGVVWLGSLGGYMAGTREPVTIAQPVGDARQADLRIDPQVARLSISAGRQANLIEGTVTPLAHESIRKDAHNAGDTLVFSLKASGERFNLFEIPSNLDVDSPTWDLRLSDQIPLHLRIDAGVGESRIDLTGARLLSLEVDAGVGDTEITLPAAGRFRVDIDSGVGRVVLRIPEELGARIQADQGLGEIRYSGEFDLEGRGRVTPDFDQAEHRVEIDIDGGVGEIIIERF